jgi:beta-1,4-mannosyl-glycoprotein beta-1,4-N-acetylglucosaminyltransferase
MLEIRLNVLNDVVDYFVLAESTRTFTGKPKPLYFEENKDRFEKFSHKIRHVVVGEDSYNPNNDAWERQFKQRNAIFDGIKKDCKKDDFVIISDVDEIINPLSIVDFIENTPNSIAIFKQKCYYYYLNCLSSEIFMAAKMAKYKHIDSPQGLRLYPKYNLHKKRPLNRLILKWLGSIRKRISNMTKHTVIYTNGGWHFTYVKSYEEISKKIENLSQEQYDKNIYGAIDIVKDNVDKLKDPYNRHYKLKIIEVDESFPNYIIDNQKKYNHIIFKESDKITT